MRTLRAGCPWDREQTHGSLARYAIEEAYEVVEAIDALRQDGTDDGPPAEAIDHFQDELGDLLLQVIFHACIGAENGWFTLADIAAAQHDKLVHRHPWVFPRDGFAVEVSSADDAVSNWDRVKGRSFDDDPMAGLPGNAPALTYAVKVLKRAGDHPLADDGDLGSTLMRIVAAARRQDPEVDPEVALRTAAARLRDAVREARTPTAG